MLTASKVKISLVRFFDSCLKEDIVICGENYWIGELRNFKTNISQDSAGMDGSTSYPRVEW